MSKLNITQKNFRQLYNSLKQSAKKRNIPFDLNLNEFYSITIPLRCPVLGTVLVFNTGKVEDDSVSFDRFDSSLGYTFDNLIVVSNRANKLKSDATLKELQQLSEYYTQLNEEKEFIN